MATDLSGWLSTGEAARYAGVSRQRIDQLIRRGIMEGERVAGRWVVHRRSVDAWLGGRPRRGAWRPHTIQELRFKRGEILDLAVRHRLGNVRVFGSVARGDATTSSDVDVLVDRLSGGTALDVAEFATDLEDSLGCSVDVIVDGRDGPAMQAIRAAAVPL